MIIEEYMLAVKMSETTGRQKENKSLYPHHFLICSYVWFPEIQLYFFPFKVELYRKC